jgi:hypothetical protein
MAELETTIANVLIWSISTVMATTLCSKPAKYWKLYFAIREAADDPREAPWYGPWNTVLQDLFHDFCVAPLITLTFPQYPVVKNIDSVDARDNCDSSDDGSDEDDDQAGPLVI